MENISDRWLEIDIDAIKHNLEQVKSLLPEKVRLIAVVKADGYGHGAVETSRLLYQNGVDFFGVSFLDEAVALRQAGIRASIMLFSPLVNEQQVTTALTNYITLTITSLNDCTLLDKISRRMNVKTTVHLKVDTGLGRFGLNREELIEVCQTLKDNPCIYIEGIYTHMAEAASNNPIYTQKQFSRFLSIIDELKQAGFKIPVCHCANSAVFLNYPEMYLNAVRIGTLISGELPAGKFMNQLDLINPYKYKSRVISLRTLDKGSYLGYNRTVRLNQPAQIAVIPVGFNHGLALQVANRPAGWGDFLKVLAKSILAFFHLSRFTLKVKINGCEYPIRGKVFMQMALVEIPVEAWVKIGDEVEVPVRKTLAARNLNRIYIKDGEPCKIEAQERIGYIVEEDS
ncbi:MAG: alanine racemase [Syntrophomonadaceae bacterium]|nr:alanine racemase [Syntrophomonadaceae bacterium]